MRHLCASLRKSSRTASRLSRNLGLGISLLMLGLTGQPCAALEGGVTSDEGWDNSTENQPFTEEQRAAELKQREEDIAADIARLKKRLETAPSPELTEQLNTKLKEVIEAKGLVREQNRVYGVRDIEPIVKGMDQVDPNMLACIIQLKNDLAERGIDFIFMPLPPTPHVYSHDLVDGIDANMDYTPGWTKMLLEFLENDVEIIDPIEEFRAHSKDELVVKWPNDFHTGDGGRMIAAQLLNERLQRYQFVQDLAPFKETYVIEEYDQPCTKTRIAVVNGQGKSSDDPGFASILKPTSFKAIKVSRKHLVPLSKDDRKKIKNGKMEDPNKNLRSDIVLIGDSQLHSAVYGSGWPAIAMSQIGGTFRWGSRSGGISHSLPEIYLDIVPDFATQPRVVVATTLTKYFWKPIESGPKALPKVGEKNDLGIPKTRFNCTVKITKISKRPTEDHTELDYQFALFHAAAIMIDGPLAGQEIGLRYTALTKKGWTGAYKAHEVGKEMSVRLWDWDTSVKTANKSKATWQVFDDTDQDLLVPIFWVDAGPIAGKRL